uniref:Uncharacterized protein n=1 Tax=Oryza brachyantha TaxID=4533 RepID=J3NEJ5_ORYBR
MARASPSIERKRKATEDIDAVAPDPSVAVAGMTEVFVHGHGEEYSFHVDDFLSDECSNEQSGNSSQELDDDDDGEEVEEEDELDFQFMDAPDASTTAGLGEVGVLCSPFDVVAAELGGAVEADGETEPAVHDAMRQMDYERKISASLYALSGVSECLRIRAGAAREQLSGLREACRKKQQEAAAQQQQQQEPSRSPAIEASAAAAAEDGKAGQDDSSGGASEAASGGDGDVLMWSSLDLAPICHMA